MPLDCELVLVLTGVAIVGICWLVAIFGGFFVVSTALGCGTGNNLPCFFSNASFDFEVATVVAFVAVGFFEYVNSQ